LFSFHETSLWQMAMMTDFDYLLLATRYSLLADYDD
jgi:hypothetical protein